MNDSQHVNVELFEVILLSYSTLSYIERKKFQFKTLGIALQSWTKYLAQSKEIN